jgi:hypothetical protein
MKELDVLKVNFFPGKTPFPTFTKESYLRQTAEDMLHLLQPDSPTSPVHNPLSFGPNILNAYAKVAKILRRAIRPPPTPPALLPIFPQVAEPITPLPNSAILSLLPRLIVASDVTPPRVSIVPLPPSPAVSLPRVPIPLTKRMPLPVLPRKSPRARLSRLRFDHRSHQRHLVQSVQHDPTIAGKMYHPLTGKVENIDSLLRGPDALKWYQSLTNEWGRCT